jgi:peptidoglycan/LPS O-acetylase OafA/YrhL
LTRIDSLTGLRFFAALVVFASHLAQPEAMPPGASVFLQAGYNGVTLFFVLSGFVLTWTYADRLARPDGAELWNFAVARFARLAPLYLVVLLFMLSRLRDGVPDWAWRHLLAVQTWSGDLVMAFNLNGPGWSVGVEVFLYALFPLLLWVLLPVARRWPLGLLVAAAGTLTVVTTWFYVTGAGDRIWLDPASAHRWLYRMPLTRVPDFVIGIALAMLVRRSPSVHPAAPVVQWGSLLVIGYLMANEAFFTSTFSWDLGYALPFAALIWSLAVGPDTVLAQFLSRPLVVRGGLVSYAFYLFHMPMLTLLGVDTTTWTTWGLSVAGALAITLLLATGAHLAIEVPAQRWLRTRLSIRSRVPGRRLAPEPVETAP